MTTKILQHFLFRTGLFKKGRLVHKTWASLFKNNKHLLELRKSQNRFRRSVLLNNFVASFLIISTIVVLLAICCFIPESISTDWFSYLSFIKFPKVENAYSLISETVGAAATIIGLSFVVIGFIFETIKNRTQRTYKDIFRITNLYYVFSISIISIISLVILNTLKYTVSQWTAGNFAILGTFLLLMTTVAIAHLFYKVLAFFNPDYIARLYKNAIKRSAELRILQTKFIEESAKVFEEQMKEYGFKIAFLSPNLFGREVSYIKLQNVTEMQLNDIFFPAFHYAGKKINKRCEGINVSRMKLMERLFRGKQILWFDKNIKVSKFEQNLLTLSLYLKPTKDDEFTEEMDKMGKKLDLAAESGNIEMLTDSLSDIELLYETYYKYGR